MSQWEEGILFGKKATARGSSDSAVNNMLIPLLVVVVTARYVYDKSWLHFAQ